MQSEYRFHGAIRDSTDGQADREEALKDDFQFESGTYGYDDSEEEWDDEEANWGAAENEEEASTEAKDESTAYLEFLNEEVSLARDIGLLSDVLLSSVDLPRTVYLWKLADTHRNQAQKFKPAETEESDDELGEDSVLLESPLDRIDPYLAFRNSFRSKCHKPSQQCRRLR
jgi:hypothetical protein